MSGLGSGKLSVWCAIPTQETEHTSSPVYVPTLVPADDMAVGYRNANKEMYRGCSGFSDDAIKALMIAADPCRRFRPRQHVWRVIRPGDSTEKRILEFEAKSLDELWLKLVSDGYAV